MPCTDDDCKKSCPGCTAPVASPITAAPVPDGRRWSDGRRWAAGSDSHNLQPLGVPGELTCTGCGIGLLIEGAK